MISVWCSILLIFYMHTVRHSLSKQKSIQRTHVPLHLLLSYLQVSTTVWCALHNKDTIHIIILIADNHLLLFLCCLVVERALLFPLFFEFLNFTKKARKMRKLSKICRSYILLTKWPTKKLLSFLSCSHPTSVISHPPLQTTAWRTVMSTKSRKRAQGKPRKNISKRELEFKSDGTGMYLLSPISLSLSLSLSLPLSFFLPPSFSFSLPLSLSL
jgi:hypothetical protein